jgi:hypothetical protein
MRTGLVRMSFSRTEPCHIRAFCTPAVPPPILTFQSFIFFLSTVVFQTEMASCRIDMTKSKMVLYIRAWGPGKPFPTLDRKRRRCTF